MKKLHVKKICRDCRNWTFAEGKNMYPNCLNPECQFYRQIGGATMDGQKITLIGESTYEGQPHTKVTLETNAVTLGDILPVMGEFLRGMGFIVEGDLAIVPYEE